MGTASCESIVQKYESLPEAAKREVSAFIDLLIQKRKPKRKKIEKKKLLQISCWNDEDIKAIEEVGKEINKWNLETF
jgi:hypothetical protein